ncbi:MAG: hypothetical protein HOO06_14050 [Bdellovibrionaceae bacterium]|jgi:hypothetical protein|nr:hypothetical protein [Pseudobdellovibrionaceae bacterium]
MLGSESINCSNIQSPCTAYKEHIESLTKSDLTLEVGSQFGSVVGNCTKGWTIAGASLVWSGLTNSTANFDDVKKCLNSVGKYTHSTNFLFHGTFDVYLKYSKD